ncbi:hypothetical protein ACQP3J_32675, partial [Escherichia coli]
DKVSLSSPSWPGTHGNPPATASAIKVCTMPSYPESAKPRQHFVFKAKDEHVGISFSSFPVK